MCVASVAHTFLIGGKTMENNKEKAFELLYALDDVQTEIEKIKHKLVKEFIVKSDSESEISEPKEY